MSLIHRVIFLELDIITRGRVYSGMFKGMHYVGDKKLMGRNYFSRLLGVYEKEITNFINKIKKNNYKLIIDAGAAEGFFANGLAKFTNSNVIAYEQDDYLRSLIIKCAKKNNISELIEARGTINSDILKGDLDISGKKLLFMDLDGLEKKLLDLNKIPSLKDTDILVETHDFVDQDITETIINRFKDTHEISRVDEEDRTIDDFPIKNFFHRLSFVKKHHLDFLHEGRPSRQSWLFMIPKKS